jgi:hypothetical protein
MGMGVNGGAEVLRDDEYLRLQATLLAIAQQSDQPDQRARWIALFQACGDELLTSGKMHSKPTSYWQRAA